MKQCYLIIQINLDQPTVMPFENVGKLDKYVNEKLGGVSKAAIFDNTYYVHINQVKEEK